MMQWLARIIWRRPARSMTVAASSVAATLTLPTMMLPTTGDCSPALANTCARQ